MSPPPSRSTPEPDSPTPVAPLMAVATTTREDLERLHPAWVEGLPLGAVLDKAAVEDYDDLLDPAILEGFARALIASAELDTERYRGQARREVAQATVRVEEEGRAGALAERWRVVETVPGRVPGSVLEANVPRYSHWWVELVDGRVMAVEPNRALSYQEMARQVAEKPGLVNGAGVRKFWVRLSDITD